jgi:wyosine [tRNA(Phe)-imidazoG37] synthetase (radical SAM superfamily)
MRKNMELASMDYIIRTVFKTNILPVISECNTNCIFCSHKQNPKQVQVLRLPKLEMKDFEEIIEFLSPNKKIVIGEAATRIIEGEPFLFKEILKLLTLIREKFKHTPIQITTNGLLLDERIVETLIELGNIELNISVNCVNPLKHKQILGLKSEQNIKENLLLISGKIKFSGSCVLVPEIMDWKEIEEICSFLDECNAETLRLFIPGATKLSKTAYNFFELYNETKKFVDIVRNKYSIPIILEPPVIGDLNCHVEGIIKNSPAFNCGIKVGDMITHINEKVIESRVDAFDKVFRSFNPKLKIIREKEQIDLKLLKPKNSSPGFIVLYDVDPKLSVQVKNVVKRNDGKNILFITSELALDILVQYFRNNDFDFKYSIISAKNSFFGGTIKCAGLLTIQDIIETAEEYLKTNPVPDLIILPPIMLDSKREDLIGRSLNEIENLLKIKADIP